MMWMPKRIWFELYRSHRAAPRVLQAHRSYLLTRGMATVAAVFAVLLATTVFVGPVSHNIAGLYAFALLLQDFMIATTGRNHGNRFV